MNAHDQDKNKSEEIPDFTLRAVIVWIKMTNFDSVRWLNPFYHKSIFRIPYLP